jgi:hypothetical protein
MYTLTPFIIKVFSPFIKSNPDPEDLAMSYPQGNGSRLKAQGTRRK